MTMTFRDLELAGWTTRAESYDRLFTPITIQVTDPIARVLGELSGRTVLDVCCGPGHLTAALAAKGALMEGLDFAATMIARARSRYPGLRFAEGDAEALPFADASFDHVVCAYGIMHLTRAEAAVAEAFRVLRPGGRFAFTQWAKDDDVLLIAGAALARHGAPVPGLPEAPPPLRFSDPDECSRILVAAGFVAPQIERLELVWLARKPEELVDLIQGGAVRLAMVIDAQEPQLRARIHEALLAAMRAHSVGSGYRLRRPSVLAWAQKP